MLMIIVLCSLCPMRGLCSLRSDHHGPLSSLTLALVLVLQLSHFSVQRWFAASEDSGNRMKSRKRTRVQHRDYARVRWWRAIKCRREAQRLSE